jgi:two-component system chemotaxis response regulator CheB
MTAVQKIKVLCVDDSALIRSLMTEIINSQPDMSVCATAPDPLVARELIKQHNRTCSRSTSKCRAWTDSTSSRS